LPKARDFQVVKSWTRQDFLKNFFSNQLFEQKLRMSIRIPICFPIGPFWVSRKKERKKEGKKEILIFSGSYSDAPFEESSFRDRALQSIPEKMGLEVVIGIHNKIQIGIKKLSSFYLNF